MRKVAQKTSSKTASIKKAAEVVPPQSSTYALENPRLRKFIAVAEELSFRRAADRLNMSQPPLSAAIKELEEMLGAKLLERDKRTVRLTSTGMAFLKEAKLAQLQVERAIRVVREREEGFTGRLRIGLSGSLGYGFLPDLLSAFRQRYRQVKLDFLEGTSLEQSQAVSDGRLDVGFVRVPIAEINDLEFKPIYRDKLIVILPAAHRLAQCESVDLKDLAGEEFVASSGMLVPGLRNQIDRVCRSVGFVPNVQCELHSVLSIVSLVSGGIGVALVPGACQVCPHDGVVYKKIRNETADIELEVLAIWRKANTSKAAANFLDLAEELRTPRNPERDDIIDRVPGDKHYQHEEK